MQERYAIFKVVQTRAVNGQLLHVFHAVHNEEFSSLEEANSVCHTMENAVVCKHVETNAWEVIQ